MTITAACSNGTCKVVEIQQQPPRHPLFAAVCGDGEHAFVYYGDKTVQCVEIDSGAVKGEKRMPKRPTVLVPYTFAGGKHMCLVADKFGDVHALPAPMMNQSVYLLGHTASMIADMTCSPSFEHLITCDRDEKIRVSCLPHAEKIESFCLGHTSYLCSADMINDGILVSVGADKQLRSWAIKEGKQLGNLALQHEEEEQPMNFETPEQEASEVKEEENQQEVGEENQEEDNGEAEDEMDKAEFAHIDTRGPVPLRVRASAASSLVAVATKGVAEVQIFRISQTQNGAAFDMATTVELPSPAVEIYFLDAPASTQLFVLLPAPHFLQVFDVNVAGGSETVHVAAGEHPVVANFNEVASTAQLELAQWLPFAELDAPEQGLVKRYLDTKFRGVTEGKRKRGKKRRTA